ncbi:MAG: helix-turn-helix domain-containing protein [Anaerolinea sp.]
MSKNESFGPVLDGITLPETIILPPEIVPLLPWMNLAELKVTVAAIARLMQVGGAEPITLSEFETMTGLSRPAVLDGIERAMKRGLLTRFEMTGYRGHTMHVYELKPRFIGGKNPPIDDSSGSIGKDFIGKKFLPITPIKAKQSKDVVNDSDSTTNLTLLNLSASPNFSQKTPENDAKNALFVQLRKMGIYSKTARFLLDNFPLERIEKCLALYPLAVKTGRADGPGWLVKAISDPDWDLDLEQEDLQEREEAERAVEQNQSNGQAKQTKPQLPRSVLIGLQEIGWNGNTAELEEHYRSDRKAFKAWLEWALTQPKEHAAARFLNGLRSGLLPPKSHTDRRRYYLEGPYAELIEH